MKPRKRDIINGIEVKTHPIFTNYAVSKCGKVYSKPRRDRMNHRLGGWLKQPPGTKRALFVNLSEKGKRYLRRVHRLVLETYIGPRPVGMECRHLDGNPTNNNLDNLCWGTPSENQADRLIHGTDIRGEKSGMSKLTEKDVRLIFQTYHDGIYSQSYLAEQFGVARTTVQAIIEKRTWKHLWEIISV